MKDDLFILMMVGMLVWMVYMYTFRTEDMMKIQKQHHEHMGKVARGAAKAGLFGVRLWRR